MYSMLTAVYVWYAKKTTNRVSPKSVFFYRAAYKQSGLSDGKGVHLSVRHTREL